MAKKTRRANDVAEAVRGAVNRAAVNPAVPIPTTAGGMVADVIVGEVLRDPRMQHLNSTEAWYRSRANWSAIVAGLTPIAALLGYQLAPEDQIMIAGALTIAGNLLAAYLARRARTASKPLGA